MKSEKIKYIISKVHVSIHVIQVKCIMLLILLLHTPGRILLQPYILIKEWNLILFCSLIGTSCQIGHDAIQIGLLQIYHCKGICLNFPYPFKSLMRDFDFFILAFSSSFSVIYFCFLGFKCFAISQSFLQKFLY